MGKTNLLEAIYYLCMCRSPLGLNDRNLCTQGRDFFRLQGTFTHDERRLEIVAKVQPGKQKEFSRNGMVYPLLSEHIGLLPVVFVSPFDVDLIREGSETRRKFLDNTLSQIDPDYLRQLILYNKVLQQRNALLKQFGENRSFQADLLDIYSQQLIAPAQFIYRARRQLIQKLTPWVAETIQRLSGEREIVALRYRSQLEEEDFGQLLEDTREKDRNLLRTTCGIHRDDIILTLDDQPVKRFGSQGQTKSLALALKLAQYELIREQSGKFPLLLLDDIFDRLDRERVSALLELISGTTFGQVFITDTQSERLDPLIGQKFRDYRKFYIHQGQVTQKPGS